MIAAARRLRRALNDKGYRAAEADWCVTDARVSLRLWPGGLLERDGHGLVLLVGDELVGQAEAAVAALPEIAPVHR